MKFEDFLKFFAEKFGSKEKMRTFAIPFGKYAEIAQLVEQNLAKVRVASSSLVFRSKTGHLRMTFVMKFNLTRYNIYAVVLLQRRLFYFKSLSTHLWQGYALPTEQKHKQESKQKSNKTVSR